ncbi:MAG TPA: CoA ester lyase [Luteibacter sp.]|nr:CoA ester lyase [Luteibacter sp.]
MKLRSLLFVPCDRPERMVKAQQSQADGVILDLEDSVAPERKVAARASLASFLAHEERLKPTFVRINPLASGLTLADLAVLVEHRPDGLILPKACGRRSIDQLDALLDELGLPDIPILPIATETPTAMFELGTYQEVAHRLVGLTWGAEDLSAAMGASAAREADGQFTAPYQVARSLALFAAHAAGVIAIETVHPDFRDMDNLARVAKRAARDGFSGMLAIHPTQLETINAAFSPSEAEMTRARAIVAAFAAHPQAGALSLDGEMIDAPHLKQARLLLGRFARD